MPIYEYECSECARRVEAIQKVDDPPLTQCPDCGGALRKRLSAPAFQFKGSGWYVTDYTDRGKRAKDEAKAASKEGAESGTKSGGESGTSDKGGSSEGSSTSGSTGSK